jgi:hypothetical protein
VTLFAWIEAIIAGEYQKREKFPKRGDENIIKLLYRIC